MFNFSKKCYCTFEFTCKINIWHRNYLYETKFNGAKFSIKNRPILNTFNST